MIEFKYMVGFDENKIYYVGAFDKCLIKSDLCCFKCFSSEEEMLDFIEYNFGESKRWDNEDCN